MISLNEKKAGFRRIIGEVKGAKPGPTLVFFGGIHGNEPSGVIALEECMELLDQRKEEVRGRIIAIAGNLGALRNRNRYATQDLNRIWSAERINAIQEGSFHPTNPEEREQEELWRIVVEVLDASEGPIYFFDLHTTSGHTPPFIVMNDSLLNRKFTLQYPLPIILGIEEYLDGPLLSYINELGYVAFGYEGGQHDDPVAIANHANFFWLSLRFTGALKEESYDFQPHYTALEQLAAGKAVFYEIFYRYRIKEGEAFRMEPGFLNFQHVAKGRRLATSNGEPIISDRSAYMFMPLYQAQGSEGFFAIRPVPGIFLRLSSLFRKMRVDKLLPILPGITRLNAPAGALNVDRRVARFLAKQIFHLMGYRSRTLDGNHFIITNREAASKTELYAKEPWS